MLTLGLVGDIKGIVSYYFHEGSANFTEIGINYNISTPILMYGGNF
ncbi:hypothetical protein [Hathewaya limosa]|nr:hypothetical protein [Hathewaya limosa]